MNQIETLSYVGQGVSLQRSLEFFLCKAKNRLVVKEKSVLRRVLLHWCRSIGMNVIRVIAPPLFCFGDLRVGCVVWIWACATVRSQRALSRYITLSQFLSLVETTSLTR